jgi:hypothetical protein
MASMNTTFDQILPKLTELFVQHSTELAQITPLLVNRDLSGRVRLIVQERIEHDPAARAALATLCSAMLTALGVHAFAPERAVLFEAALEDAYAGSNPFALEGVPGVQVIDRLATQGDWATIAEEAQGSPRIVFFSIKGGVGRSSALAVAAWQLAQDGKRVLVLDLDLESPGLSSSLLPPERQPTYGIADWLVEDLLDNADALLPEMVATSELSREGEIYLVPAHGRDPGEYVAKLGRVWMPKVSADGSRESWSARLRRLLAALEAQYTPDVILIDSRAGIDEVASACVTDLGANLVLLFALEGTQTWTGYRILFEHWRSHGVAPAIRERLQLVGAMLPELDTRSYWEGLREHGWYLFQQIYDEQAPGQTDGFNYDLPDDQAPHTPWPIQWHRSFAALSSLHSRLEMLDTQQVQLIFGGLTQALSTYLEEASE